MKLHIIDLSWGVNRRTGERSENIAAEVDFDVKEGDLPPVGPSRKVFRITKVLDGSITLWLSEKSGEVVLEVGKPYDFRPLSRDGGHRFRFELGE